MKFSLADRLSNLGTETAFEVLAKAKALEAQGRNIVHLEIGEPDFDTPKNIREAAKKALDDGFTHYGPAAGLMETRQAIGSYLERQFGQGAEPDEVVVTPGAKPIMFFGMMATVNEGDEVIYPDPGFPIYESVIRFLKAKPVPLPLREEQDFCFSLQDLESRITDKTKLVIINSPQNPTGGTLTRQEVQDIAKLLIEKDVNVLSDEIYSRMIYGGEHASLWAQPGMKERTILLDGFSKTYAMTGWRLGFGVMPAPLATMVAKLMVNSNSCTAAFSQIAGIEALNGPQDEVAKMVREFEHRRDVIVDGLNAIEGVTCKRPKGAFYVFPNFKSFGKPGKALADHLLNDGGVACLSGTAFGPEGEGYLRFSYANSVANINEALNRIADSLKRLK